MNTTTQDSRCTCDVCNRVPSFTPYPLTPNELHLHELMDRCSIMQGMFDETISNHVASPEFSDLIEKCERVLGELYQEVGKARFDAVKEKSKAEPTTQEMRMRQLIGAGDMNLRIIIAAQNILTGHLPPDGTSKKQTINDLLALLDGPNQRAAQRAWADNK